MKSARARIQIRHSASFSSLRHRLTATKNFACTLNYFTYSWSRTRSRARRNLLSFWCFRLFVDLFSCLNINMVFCTLGLFASEQTARLFPHLRNLLLFWNPCQLRGPCVIHRASESDGSGVLTYKPTFVCPRAFLRVKSMLRDMWLL